MESACVHAQVARPRGGSPAPPAARQWSTPRTRAWPSRRAGSPAVADRGAEHAWVTVYCWRRARSVASRAGSAARSFGRFVARLLATIRSSGSTRIGMPSIVRSTARAYSASNGPRPVTGAPSSTAAPRPTRRKRTPRAVSAARSARSADVRAKSSTAQPESKTLGWGQSQTTERVIEVGRIV